LQKLALLRARGELALDMVQEAVVRASRATHPYDAAEALVSGELARYVRVIEGLHAEGEATTFILFVIFRRAFRAAGTERPRRIFKPFAQTRGRGVPDAAFPRSASTRRSPRPPPSIASSKGVHRRCVQAFIRLG